MRTVRIGQHVNKDLLVSVREDYSESFPTGACSFFDHQFYKRDYEILEYNNTDATS